MFDLHHEVVPSRAATIIADEWMAKLAKQLLEANTEEQLEEYKLVNSDCLLDQGISCYKVGKDMLLMQVIKQALLYRVKPSIDLFLAGMDTVGQFQTACVRRNPKAFLQLFIDMHAPLTVQQLKGLYVIKWSEDGSNKRAMEEGTIFCWEQFINQVFEGCCPEDILVFVTGANKVPPLGFSKLMSILFYDREIDNRRPSSSTCSLPRGVDDLDVFKELMISSLKESCGLGKI